MAKKRIKRFRARQVGEKAVEALRPYCQRIKICGSVRRGLEEVGDVDIVAVPNGENETVWTLSALLSVGTRLRGGKGQAKNASIEIDGVQVDVWLVPEESWGAALMFATGPAERNIRQRQHARRLGMILNQYALFNEATGEVLASRTEKDVYDALGETYLEPWER